LDRADCSRTYRRERELLGNARSDGLADRLGYFVHFTRTVLRYTSKLVHGFNVVSRVLSDRTREMASHRRKRDTFASQWALQCLVSRHR
jgi:hypothetical protein